MGLIKLLLEKLSWMPFLSGLHETSLQDHKEAITELGIGQILATMPLWAGALHVAWPQLDWNSLCEAMREMAKNGEFFIYAASTLAPIIYIVGRDRDTPRAFPSKWWYLGVVVVFTIVAAVIFISQRVKADPIGDETFNYSLYAYLATLVLLYLAFVYNNTYLPNPAGVMRKSEEDYVQRVKERR